jgi:hypothetical protein
MVRGKHRQSLKFSSTRALLMVNYNSDLVNLSDRRDIQRIRELMEAEKVRAAEKEQRRGKR